MNEVFLTLMFALNTALLLATTAKVRAWRKWIREYARVTLEAAERAKGWANAARAEANFCENSAGRCSQLEIRAAQAAQRAERATGTDGAPPTTYAAPLPKPNPAGLRIYGSDEADLRGTD